MARYYTTQYQVLVRPIDHNGKVYRGLSKSDSVYTPMYLTNPNQSQYVSSWSEYQFKGEPWLVFSTAASLEQAKESAKKAAMSVGGENVRIVKVLPHDMELVI